MSAQPPPSPKVELFWWRGCPSWERALELVRAEMRAAGLDTGDLDLIEVSDEEEAERVGFPGSPTIRIDGEDLAAIGPDAPLGLTCRVYRLRDGRLSPTPDPEDLSEALRAAGGAG